MRFPSPLRYPGGKSWLLDHTSGWLRHVQPAHLVEPFAGGASVSLAALGDDLVDRATIVELDDDLACFWAVALHQADALIELVEAFVPSRAGIYAVIAARPVDAVERAFCTLVRNRTAWSGILAPSAGVLKDARRSQGVERMWQPRTLVPRIAAVAALSDRLTVIHGDGLQVLQETACAAAFIDPPYLAGADRLYRHSVVDHAAVFRAAAAFSAPLMTYDDLPAVWQLAGAHGFKVQPVSMKTAHHRRAAELLVAPDFAWAPSSRHDGAVAMSHPPLGATTLRQHRRVAMTRCSKRHVIATRPSWRDDVGLSELTSKMSSMAISETNGHVEDLVHVDQAATVLNTSRRTVERMVERDELKRVPGEDGRAYVTKSSLVAAKELREQGTAGPRPNSQAQQTVAQLSELADKLGAIVDAQQKQLTAAQDERRDASVLAARLEEQLKAERARVAELEARVARRRWFRRAA